MKGPQILAPAPLAPRGLRGFSTSKPSNQTAIETGLPVQLSSRWPLLCGGFKTFYFHSASKNPDKQCKGSPHRIHHLWTVALRAALLL